MILNGTEVVYFQEDEFERVHEMWAPLIWELDKLRAYIGRAIGLHESNPIPYTGSSHKDGSLHYIGRAVDVYCKATPLWEFFLAASRFKFTGVGVYPYWNTPGLHLEIREDVSKPRKYWWRDGQSNYRAISIYDLHEVFTIPAVVGI